MLQQALRLHDLCLLSQHVAGRRVQLLSQVLCMQPTHTHTHTELVTRTVTPRMHARTVLQVAHGA